MAYVSYARGYKAGGFNLDRERTTATQRFNPGAPGGIAVDHGHAASTRSSSTPTNSA